MSLDRAQSWPDLLEIVEAKVKPARDNKRHDNKVGARRADLWWQYASPAKDLY